MRLIKNTFLIILFLLLSCADINSQTFQVEKISITEGLSSGSIRQTIQDSYGLIWIATEDGLNVYDG